MVLARKDLGSIWRQSAFRSMITLLPVILVVAVPIILIMTISILPDSGNQVFPQALQKLLPADHGSLPYRQAWIDAFTTLICPLLYLCVPILCSAAAASFLFVWERENGTLENLLLSSMETKSVFHTKITVCILLSIFISLVSFVAFGITLTVADLLTGAPFFFNLEWLVLLFLLMPATALFSTVFISLILMRVHSSGEALQTVGYLILPFAVLYLVQFTGLIQINFLFLTVLAVLLAAVSVVLFNLSAKGFQTGKMFDKIREKQNDY